MDAAFVVRGAVNVVRGYGVGAPDTRRTAACELRRRQAHTASRTGARRGTDGEKMKRNSRSVLMRSEAAAPAEEEKSEGEGAKPAPMRESPPIVILDLSEDEQPSALIHHLENESGSMFAMLARNSKPALIYSAKQNHSALLLAFKAFPDFDGELYSSPDDLIAHLTDLHESPAGLIVVPPVQDAVSSSDEDEKSAKTVTLSSKPLNIALKLEAQHIPAAFGVRGGTLLLESLIQRPIAHLIFNPVAGQREAHEDRAIIDKILGPAYQLHYIETQAGVDPYDQARELAAKILKSERPKNHRVLVAGGDGTVSAVAGGLVGTGLPLGVIPRGTANAFCVALGLPSDVEGACECICAGHIIDVDTAVCNDRPFILLAGIGFEADVVESATRELKNKFGQLAYIVSGATQLMQKEIFDAKIMVDGKEIDVKDGTAAITVANAAPPTSMLAQGMGQVIYDDGLLELTTHVAHEDDGEFLGRLRGADSIAKLLVAGVFDKKPDTSRVRGERGKKITIEADPPQKVVLDGEIAGTTPVDIEVVPNSLRIFSPI
eukprot:CAMPEP_0185833018 /NCGR_PEP_ID=MMETSP1353-20130828/2429_1 /TAXON_ID=1077150 /ORGANISM="Erythrolobus australicus, Strain CCMP3124" /LENGTH=546 /DNA_ID=CAMNT_0028531259 /DNA_START=129 /DNA_END=1769 /DNA_ORIENTATION=-